MTPTPESSIVDLRSDTVTRPTTAMRRAMAEAVVGDDVFGDDPTVQELELRVAQLSGKEAALYVPSGTMGNQLAVNVLTVPGEQILLESESHVFRYEQGGVAANSGCLVYMVRTPRGAVAPDQLADALDDPEDDHVARLSLLCLENTHNRHGGAIVPLESMRAVAAAAREHGLRVHLDGARLWNASVASGIPIREWAATVDTLTMCFSKGLGAPIGSILVGPSALIRRARRVRKRWGGAMRQVGILAAACLHALDHHVDRLSLDHRRARTLAREIAKAPGVTVLEPDTNIVMVDLEHPALTTGTLVDTLATRRIHVLAFGPRRLRMITHLDVDDAAIARAAGAFHEVVEEALAGGAAAR